MKKYLGICRPRGACLPMKVNIEAVGVIEAIDAMVKAVGLSSSNDLEAFEVLEIIEDGDAYVPVAHKDESISRERRMQRAAARSPQSLNGPCAAPTARQTQVEAVEEILYKPYEVEAA